MRFRVKDLENYLLKKFNWQKISEELTLKSFETNFDEGILEVDILPNRFADASSLIGLAREISALTNNKIKLPKISLKESSKLAKNYFKVINKTKFAPYYFGRIILNVKNQQSPKWLKEFVEFYGFNSVNFLVDLSNFVMIEYGAPLHIFDLDKVKKEIIVRTAKRGEKFISLDNKEYILNGEEIVIADKESILGLAGIKGGKIAEIDLNTKNIFIEAAVFDPTKIYITSRSLNISTDASFRFERKVSPYRSLLALERVSSLIQKNLGGEVLRGIIGYQKLVPKKIDFDFHKIEKFSGLHLDKKEILRILKSLGFEILNNKKILVPLDRLDINTEEDIVEEVLRIYDLNKIPSLYEPSFKEIFVEPIIEFNNQLRQILIKAGYSEAHNYNFFGDKEKDIYSNIYAFEPIEVLNPLSESYKYFQGSLIPNLLKAIYLNQFYFKEIRLFEISKVAHQIKNKIIENYSLGIVLALKNGEEILKELKGILNLLAKILQINFQIKEINQGRVFNPGGEISIEKESSGFIGLIDRKILDKLSIDLAVGVFEVNLNKLQKYSNFKKEFKPWPVFAVITRDISFFVDEEVKFSQIEKDIKKLKVNHLQRIELIDIYFTQKKSITLRLIFYNPQRNLEENEIEKEVVKIVNYLKDKYKIELR